MPRFSNAPVHRFGTTIFAEMSALAAASGAINLGQGFPDTDGPQVMLDAAKAMLAGDEDRWGVMKQGIKTKLQEFLPHKEG